MAPVGQALGVGVSSTERRTVVLPPGVQWKENKKAGNFIQSKQWTGQPGCCDTGMGSVSSQLEVKQRKGGGV